MRAPSSLVLLILIGLLCVIWGSTWVVIAGGLEDLPPFTAAAARFLVAASVMSAIGPRLARLEGGKRPSLGLSLVLGTANFALSYGIVYWSETRLASGLVALLWAVFPMMSAVSGHLFLGEKLATRQWSGILLGFGGMVVLFSKDIRELGTASGLAALVVFVSPLVSCIGQTLVKKHGAGTSSALLNRNAMWIGAALLSVLALTAERPAEVVWTRAAIASIAYLALVGTVVAFSLYFWLLRHTASYRLGVIAYVTPVIALTLGALLRDEAVSSWRGAGAVLVLLGVALSLRSKRA